MPNGSTVHTQMSRKGAYLVAGILMIIPFFAYIVLPLYDKVDPKLVGVPFFYWYQTLWLALSAILFGVAAFLISRAKGDDEE